MLQPYWLYLSFVISMKNFLLSILLIVCGNNVFGQNIHFLFGGGLMNYQGDLQAKRFTFKQAHPYGSFGVYYELTEKLFLRVAAVAGKVSANDKFSPTNQTRNLSFSSQILEFHVGAEYDLINSYEHRVSPYLFAALAGYHFSPYTFDTSNKKTFLQPLGTEGQGFYAGRKKYGLTQLAIPFGGGLKFGLTDNIHIRIEAALRVLLTDYLDDVSSTYADENDLLINNGAKAAELAFRSDEINPALTPVPGGIRGNPKSKDFYYTTGISVSFRLNSGDGGRKPGKSKLGCPVNVY